MKKLNIILSSLILLIVLGTLIVGHTLRPSRSIVFDGTTQALYLLIVAPYFMTDQGKQVGHEVLMAHVTQIVVSGTKLQFTPASSTSKTIDKKLIEPISSDHIAYFPFKEPVPVFIKLPDNALFEIYGGDKYAVSDEVTKRIPNFPTKYDIGFIFHSNSLKPLWVLGGPETGDEEKELFTVAHGRVFGFGPEKLTLSKDKVYTARLIEGYFFKREKWELEMPPFFTPLKRYHVTLSSGKSLLVDVLPKLEIKVVETLEKFNRWEIGTSMAKLEDCSGVLYIGDTKKELAGEADIEIPEGNITVSLYPKGEHILVHLGGKTNNVLIDGDQSIKSWLAKATADNPVIVNILTALIAGLLGAIVATKGRVLRDWFLESSKDKEQK